MKLRNIALAGPCRKRSHHENARGFTLVELVVVIVILGILAAVAVPRMLDLGKEARVAALNGLASTLASAADMGRAKCAATASCNMSASACSGSFPFVTINGTKIYTHFGWPSGWGRCWVDDGVGSIKDLVQLSGQFQYIAHVPGSFAAVYQMNGSPDPANCKVVYQLNSTQSTMTVNTVSSGC